MLQNTVFSSFWLQFFQLPTVPENYFQRFTEIVSELEIMQLLFFSAVLSK